MIYIPDGKTKTMSNLSTQVYKFQQSNLNSQVDVAKNILGDAKDKDKDEGKKKKEKKKKGEQKEEAEAPSEKVEETKESNQIFYRYLKKI